MSGQTSTAGAAPVVGWTKYASHVPSGVVMLTSDSVVATALPRCAVGAAATPPTSGRATRIGRLAPEGQERREARAERERAEASPRQELLAKAVRDHVVEGIVVTHGARVDPLLSDATSHLARQRMRSCAALGSVGRTPARVEEREQIRPEIVVRPRAGGVRIPVRPGSLDQRLGEARRLQRVRFVADGGDRIRRVAQCARGARR